MAFPAAELVVAGSGVALAMPNPETVALATPRPDVQPRSERVEALLRERKLDRTLTTAIPARVGAEQVAAFGLSALDERLQGGVPRGQVSELIGSVSSGRTSLSWAWLGAATRRGESVALIDTFDRFDVGTGQASGIDLSRLLWIRGQAITKTSAAIDPAWLPGARAVDGPGTLLERTIDRALKALNLVLQSGVCTAVVVDFADVPPAGIRRVPHTTWFRVQRIVEGTDIACLLLGPMPLARSAGGITINTGARGAAGASGASGASGATGATNATGTSGAADASGATGTPCTSCTPCTPCTCEVQWAGAHDRSRRLAGLRVRTRVSSPRRTVQGTAVLQTSTRNDAWAVD
jgi:recA bacterial DNA recombination protein